MKYLNRRSKSQSYAGAVIEAVFDHLNFLVSHARHLKLLGNALPEQVIKFLVGA